VAEGSPDHCHGWSTCCHALYCQAASLAWSVWLAKQLTEFLGESKGSSRRLDVHGGSRPQVNCIACRKGCPGVDKYSPRGTGEGSVRAIQRKCRMSCREAGFWWVEPLQRVSWRPFSCSLHKYWECPTRMRRSKMVSNTCEQGRSLLVKAGTLLEVRLEFSAYSPYPEVEECEWHEWRCWCHKTSWRVINPKSLSWVYIGFISGLYQVYNGFMVGNTWYKLVTHHKYWGVR